MLTEYLKQICSNRENLFHSFKKTIRDNEEMKGNIENGTKLHLYSLVINTTDTLKLLSFNVQFDRADCLS